MSYLKRHRTDHNQGVIVETLRKSGWFVHVTSSAGHGFPDLVAARGGRLELIEVKATTGKTGADQHEFHAALAAHGVTVKVLRTVDDARAL